MDRDSIVANRKVILGVFAGVGLFWLIFALCYPYQLLIDDTRYEMILIHQRYPFGDKLTRWIHHGILMLEGSIFHWGMSTSVYLSYLLHCLTVGLGVMHLVPRLPKALRPLTLIGLVIFALHPVSLQTAVHIAQRSELLGAFFLMFYAITALEAKPNLIALFALALGALFSKEPYAVVAFAHLSALGLASPGRSKWVGIIVVPTLIFGAYINSFSLSTVQNQSNYERSREFRRAVAEKRVISDTQSIYLPIRDRSENLWLQVALVPKVLEATLLPFWTVQDYGQFPYGRDTYRRDLPYFWLGALLATLMVSVLLYLRFKRQTPLTTLVFIFSPVIFYSSYWIFPVYDPLMLYRLYGVVFCFFVLSLPSLANLLMPVPMRQFYPFATALVAIYVLAGTFKFYEMIDPIRQADHEMARAPASYRATVAAVRARILASAFPIDCKAYFEPMLTLTPSTALIYIDWAYCHVSQNQMAEAKIYARKSLAQEQVPENVQVATNYLMGPKGFEVPTEEIHPENLKVMMKKP